MSNIGEFTKDLRGWFDTVLKYGPPNQNQIETILHNVGLLGIEIMLTEGRLAAKKGNKACDIIDRLTAENKIIEEKFKSWRRLAEKLEHEKQQLQNAHDDYKAEIEGIIRGDDQ